MLACSLGYLLEESFIVIFISFRRSIGIHGPVRTPPAPIFILRPVSPAIPDRRQALLPIVFKSVGYSGPADGARQQFKVLIKECFGCGIGVQSSNQISHAVILKLEKGLVITGNKGQP